MNFVFWAFDGKKTSEIQLKMIIKKVNTYRILAPPGLWTSIGQKNIVLWNCFQQTSSC